MLIYSCSLYFVCLVIYTDIHFKYAKKKKNKNHAVNKKRKLGQDEFLTPTSSRGNEAIGTNSQLNVLGSLASASSTTQRTSNNNSSTSSSNNSAHLNRSASSSSSNNNNNRHDDQVRTTQRTSNNNSSTSSSNNSAHLNRSASLPSNNNRHDDQVRTTQLRTSNNHHSSSAQLNNNNSFSEDENAYLEEDGDGGDEQYV